MPVHAIISSMTPTKKGSGLGSSVSFDVLWKLGAIIILAAITYSKVEFLEKGNADLWQQIEALRADQKWTERTLLKHLGTE